MAAENDIVLIHIEEKPQVFARIEEILPDHKPGWYHVKLLLLQLPLQSVTWILREAYINGDPYTMGGKPMRLELVEAPEEEKPLQATDKNPPAEAKKEKRSPSRAAKVISLSDLKKNK